MANFELEEEQEEASKPIRRKRDIQTENIFQRTTERATARGMKVNKQKTAMLAISDAYSYKPHIYIRDESGEELASTAKTVKILGFVFDETPTVRAQVDNIIRKTRRRFWVLRHLRGFGLSEDELVAVYKSSVRSVIEFTSVVYHAMLTKEQSRDIERLQLQSLKCIYGLQFSYSKMLEKANISTLEERRVEACDKFARKCLEGRFEGWFPLRQTTRTTRSTRPYEEKYARCDRLKNSPLYFMRRRLNDLAQENERRSAEEA
jgi:hypothetical protein